MSIVFKADIEEYLQFKALLITRQLHLQAHIKKESEEIQQMQKELNKHREALDVSLAKLVETPDE